MGSTGLASWVQAWSAVGQAILSVGAIVAAALIARGDRAHSRAQKDSELQLAAEARASRARDHALVLVIPITAWSVRWKPVRDGLASDNTGLGKMVALNALDEHEHLLDLPSEVLALAGRLSELGPAAAAVQNMVHRTNVMILHKEMLHSLVRGDFIGDELLRKEAILVKLCTELSESIARAQGRVFRLLPAPE